MNIELYLTNSPKEAVSKSITLVGTISGNLRQNGDSYNPLDIDVTISNGGLLTRSNYAKVNDRYYFIQPYSVTNTGIYNVHLHEDVLMTFPQAIKDSRGVFVRSDSGNPYLNDGTYKTLGSIGVWTKYFSKSFKATPTYLLTVAGG